MDYGGKTEVVFLPNHPIAITKALRRLGADSIGDCELSLYDFSVDNPQWCERFRDMISNEDIFGINSLAAAINAADIDLNKLWSLAEYAQAEDAVDLAQLAQHIDYFSFIEGAEDYEAVGQYLTENCDDYQLNPTLSEFFDFEALAWLELRYDLAEEGADLSAYEQGVADFGIRQCCDIEQYNDLLKDLGEDAYDMAYIPPEEEETTEMTLGGM